MLVRRLSFAVATAALSASLLAAAEPRLGGGRWLLSFSWYPHDEVSATVGGMRLSPDGQSLLFARREMSLREDGSESESWRLVLMHVADRAETELPVAPLDSDRLLRRWLELRVFEPGGSRIALPVPGAGHGGAALLDPDKGRLRRLGPGGGLLLPGFTGDGRSVVLSAVDRISALPVAVAPLDGGEMRAFPVRGVAGPACPSAPVVPVLAAAPPGHAAEPVPLVLLDVGTGSVTPVGDAGADADGFHLHWTHDGRFLYWGVFDGARGAWRTRVWDRARSRQVADIADALPVGTGPRPASMVLALERSEGQDVVLHDADRDRSRTVGHVFPNVITAEGGRVLLIDRLDEDEFEIVLAEISR